MKKRGHYCKVCGEYKANEKFSGKGHAAHICKTCAALPPERQAEEMTLTLNGKALSLTPTEFSILRILCQKKGEVVSSEELFHEIWGDEYFSKSNNTITVHIRHLREKMDDSFENPKYIKTVWGCGYKIEK